MGNEKKDNPDEVGVNRKILSIQRETQLQSWLNGEGERTPEEEEIAKRFGGPHAESFARQAISLHRKSQDIKQLSGDGNITEKEIAKRFGGPHKESYARRSVTLKRRLKLLQYLSGDENVDL